MKHIGAGEMSAAANKGETGRELAGLVFPKDIVSVVTHNPFSVIGMPVDGCVIKGAAPIHEIADEMGMRDGNPANTAEGADELEERWVKVRCAIPQDITLQGLDEKGALSNAEAWLGADADEIWFDRFDAVVMGAAKLFDGCPLLTICPDVLTRVVADWTIRGRRIAGVELDATGCTDPVLHIKRKSQAH